MNILLLKKVNEKSLLHINFCRNDLNNYFRWKMMGETGTKTHKPQAFLFLHLLGFSLNQIFAVYDQRENNQ